MSKRATRLSIASIRVRYSRNETGTLAPRSSAKNEKNMAKAELVSAPHPGPLPGKRGEGGQSPSPRASGGGRRPRSGRVRGGASRASAAFAPVQECDPLEQVDVLFVFQQSAVQWRDQFGRVARTQHVG